ncbi:MAG: hypothetical protein IIZ61_05860 [Lachnospiraceae bacterium]|nr:hypothetical protein [Lachnospiraceae bacterium]
MSKFRHEFTLEKAEDSYRVYRADNVSIRLDFISHMLRVAILRDDEPLINTYTVRPRLPEDPAPGEGIANVPREGRDKLSTEGFELVSPECREDGKHLLFSIDDIDISIELLNFKMSLTKNGKLLYHDRDYISYNFDHELGDGSFHAITREPDEKIFGMGDKTGHVNKNGMAFKMEASDSMGFDARTSDPLYKQLPFYICKNSVGSYGIYYDTYSNGEMNFGKEINNYYAPFKSARFDEENLVFYIIFGTVEEIVHRFSLLMGPVYLPPVDTLYYSGSTMTYTDAPDAEAQLKNFVSLCEEYGIHPHGFYLSSGYTSIGDKRYVFHWNKEKIPSPEGLAKYFDEHGISFYANVKPAFLRDHPMYKEIADKGWFLHYKDGTPALFPFWDDFGSYLDFTNPEAFDFWTQCVKRELIDKGYKNIWNDNNEYDIRDKEVYACGFGKEIRAYLIRPLFSFLMTMASRAAQDPDSVSVSRCGIGGLSRIATTWTGDNNTSFSDFRYNHYMAMTMSLSGFFNFGQDIGGFAGERPGKELFMRWLQYGIFTPRFVLHSWNPDGIPTMPWLYEEMMPYVKRLFDLREVLVPYLYEQMKRSARDNMPIIYPVFMKYSEYDTESDLFFFGDDILVAPIFDEGANGVEVILPGNDGWFLRGEGQALFGRFYVSCGITDLPVYFVRGTFANN